MTMKKQRNMVQWKSSLDYALPFPAPFRVSAMISVTKWGLKDVILVESILIRASLLKWEEEHEVSKYNCVTKNETSKCSKQLQNLILLSYSVRTVLSYSIKLDWAQELHLRRLNFSNFLKSDVGGGERLIEFVEKGWVGRGRGTFLYSNFPLLSFTAML